MGKPMVVMQDVSFAYGKDDILTNVNLIVEEQEYVGIIGANGAGKSTLMRLILGQLSPSKGEVTVHAKSIGYVPQVGFHAMSNFPANVEEIVLTGLHAEIGLFHFPKKEHRKKVKETLELVGMQDYRRRMLSELSGGQQQRVLIARALIQNPQLLVLDEPLTGIDKEAGEMLYQLLPRYAEISISIIMSVGIGLASVLTGFIEDGAAFNSFLFGSIVAITDTEVILVIVVTVIVVVTFLLLYKELMFITFDEQGAILAGVPVKKINFVVTLLTAITVSVAARSVGALIVSSLMVIPVACAMQIANSYKKTVIFSVLFAVAFTIVGLTLSYYYNLKPGGTIVLTGVVVLIPLMIAKKE